MKHNLKITLVLLGMFVITQFIGLYVVNHYSQSGNELPFNLGEQQPSPGADTFVMITIAFVFAILIFFFLTKFNIGFVLKIWFFVVVIIALSISLLGIIPKFQNQFYVVIALSLILAIEKTYKQNMVVHNLTELLIYPGIAAVFVPILNVNTIILLLVLISVYDAWAVWHSGVMQKMAKYQIDNLKIFSGFFIPYASKKVKSQIKKWKNNLTQRQLAKKKIKVSVAILGGGDVVFPIITAGVMLLTLGFWSAVFVIIGATLGLAYLFFFAEKKKFYPAMPFITTGILLGIIASYLIL